MLCICCENSIWLLYFHLQFFRIQYHRIRTAAGSGLYRKGCWYMKDRKPLLRRMDYSWVIIGICFTVVFTSLGLCSSGRTLYLTAITEALHIPRGAFSLNNTFRFVTTTVLNLFFGPLVKRFGTKKLMCAGFCCLISFALLNSVATGLLTFYIAGVLLGVGLSWTSTTMMSTVVSRWCQSNKATVTGMILAANGIGGAVAVQILSPIIFEEGNPFGYRTSYRYVAAALAVVLLLVLTLYREAPKSQEEAEPVPGKKKKIRGAGWIGMEYEEVLKKPYFYLTLVCMFLTGMVLQGLGGIAVPHMYDLGMDVDYVAAIVSISGLVLTCTKFLMGYLYDRFGIRVPMNLALICAFLSMAILIILKNTPTGKALAFIRVFIGTFATPLETVMLPIFAVEFFGNKAFDKLIGIFTAVSTAGFAIGSPVGNLFYDVFGSYRLAFAVFAVLMAIVAVSLQFVLRAANRDRQKILGTVG